MRALVTPSNYGHRSRATRKSSSPTRTSSSCTRIIRPGNRTDVRDAIWLFGVCYVGVQLPIAAQNSPWDITPGTPLVGDLAPGSWGGHLIPVVDYDVETLTCITWGTLKKLSWAWWDSYTDEAFALLSKDWIENSGHAPPGFDMTTLAEHMKALRH